MEIEDETKLKKQLFEIEDQAFQEQLNLIMNSTKITEEEIAYKLLMNYRNVWNFTCQVSTSGNSVVITLPKKKVKEKGIGKGSNLLVSIKPLRFLR